MNLTFYKKYAELIKVIAKNMIHWSSFPVCISSLLVRPSEHETQANPIKDVQR